MKRNKRRAHTRLKPYLWDQIAAIADKFQTSYTDVIEMALEKGLTWYVRKIRKELDKKFLLPKEPNQAQEQNYPNTFKTYDEWNQHCIENYGKTAEELHDLFNLKWIEDYEPDN